MHTHKQICVLSLNHCWSFWHQIHISHQNDQTLVFWSSQQLTMCAYIYMCAFYLLNTYFKTRIWFCIWYVIVSNFSWTAWQLWQSRVVAVHRRAAGVRVCSCPAQRATQGWCPLFCYCGVQLGKAPCPSLVVLESAILSSQQERVGRMGSLVPWPQKHGSAVVPCNPLCDVCKGPHSGCFAESFKLITHNFTLFGHYGLQSENFGALLY